MSVGHDHHGPGPYVFFLVVPVPRELIDDGLCAVEDVWPNGLWDLSVPGESVRQRKERRALAKRVCSQCPVRALCGDFARQTSQSGVWGGEVFPPLASRGGDGAELQGAPCDTTGDTRRGVGTPRSA